MGERVLVSLDGSRTSEKALDYVIQLFKDIKSDESNEVVLFEVIKPPVHHCPVEGGVVDIEYSDEEIIPLKETARIYLEKMAESLKEHGIHVSCEVIKARPGLSTAECIIDAERELNGNLLAMSTHGRKGFSRWLYGSVAESVMRGGSLPVVTVKA